MSRIRVMDLAKELSLDNKTTIVKLQEMGISVKNHFSGISEQEAEKFRGYVRGGKATEKEAAKPASKVIIRRRPAEELRSEPASVPEPIVASVTVAPVEELEPVIPQPILEPEVLRAPVAEKPALKEPVVEQHVVAQPEEIAVPIPAVIVEPVVVEPEEIKPAHAEPQKVPAFSSQPSAPTPERSGNVRTQSGIMQTSQSSTPEANRGAQPQKANVGGSYSAVVVRRDIQQNALVSSATSTGRTYTRPQQTATGGLVSGQPRQAWAPKPGEEITARSPRNIAAGNESADKQGGWQPRPRPGGPGATGGEGFNRPSPGGDRGGARPGPGGRPTSFVSSDSSLPAGKDPGMLRARVDKDRERDRARLREAEEETARRNLKLKGRHEDEFLEEEGAVVEGEEGAEANVRTVYTPTPNRRRGSGVSRKKDMRKIELANPTKQSKKTVRIDEGITVNDLAGEMSVKGSAVIKALMQFGTMAGINQVLDFDTATLVAQEFGFETQNTAVSIGDILGRKSADASEHPESTRAPVVTVMGHVDHGKTSLLDAIRQANVAGGEAGGITQHIGAYQVEWNDRKITFLDTPGHEAFTAMRARGAQVTDVVVLVVAADDGVMPQTIEAINHAKAAEVPIVVAINKIDKPGVNIDRVLRELSVHGVMSEEWGGDSIFVQVSAKTKQGIEELLETILLQADVLDLRSRQDGLATGVVIEARLDKARGPVATLIVTQGTLRPQDWVVAGTTCGRIRAIFSDKGERLTEALPAMPVSILGLDEVPAASDAFNVVANDAVAKEAVAYRVGKQREKGLSVERKATMEDLLARMSQSESEVRELPLIVKADTQGSVEALRSTLQKISTEKIKTRIIHAAVGGITETDITLAKAASAVVVGFNVRPDRVATTIAEREGVDVRYFSIIYELVESVEGAMAGRLAPIRSEKTLGRAEIRNLFSVPKIGVIAGSNVTDGKITRNSHIRVVRDGTVVYTGRVGSLKRFKEDAREVLQGFECGVGVENYNDLKVGDVLEAFVIEETAATLH